VQEEREELSRASQGEQDAERRVHGDRDFRHEDLRAQRETDLRPHDAAFRAHGDAALAQGDTARAQGDDDAPAQRAGELLGEGALIRGSTNASSKAAMDFSAAPLPPQLTSTWPERAPVAREAATDEAASDVNNEVI
jgi:hypothetical protein